MYVSSEIGADNEVSLVFLRWRVSLAQGGQIKFLCLDTET
jgi:hypothetical protein